MSEQNEVVVYDAEVQMVEQRRFMPVMTLDSALARRETIVNATGKLIKEGVDFGVIPGTGSKPALLQPGADKLCNLFGLVIRYEILEQVQDWTGEQHGGEPFFYYFVKGRAFRGNDCMGEGVGSCSSWEAKYRWRKAERKCPACGLDNIRSSKEGGWYCWKKTQGCGATFPEGDKRIESQEVGRKPNTDVHDLVNTVQKMAFKRCKVSTTINATSASEFFTQDVEDNLPPQEEHNPTAQNKEKTSAAKKAEWAKSKAAQQEVLDRKMKDLEDRSKISPAVSVVDPGIDDSDLPSELGGTYVAPPNPAEQMKAQARTAVAPFSKLEKQLIDSTKQANAWKEAHGMPATVEKPWTTKKEMVAVFAAHLRELAKFDDDPAMSFAKEIYQEELSMSHVDSPEQFRTTAEAVDCHGRLLQRIALCSLRADQSALRREEEQRGFLMEERQAINE